MWLFGQKRSARKKALAANPERGGRAGLRILLRGLPSPIEGAGFRVKTSRLNEAKSIFWKRCQY